jgi:hypothetical protein
MKYEVPLDTELYRQQLETRARIVYSTSEIWLRVQPEESGQWVADLHHRISGDAEEPSFALEPWGGNAEGTGATAQAALEEFAGALDARELAQDKLSL